MYINIKKIETITMYTISIRSSYLKIPLVIPFMIDNIINKLVNSNDERCVTPVFTF